jgi:hypothetical protein
MPERLAKENTLAYLMHFVSREDKNLSMHPLISKSLSVWFPSNCNQHHPFSA